MKQVHRVQGAMTTNANARGSERMRAFMAARILFNKGMMHVDCTIRNISEGGAKLEISGAVTLPEEFDLVIPQKNQRRRARLCWRQDDACGVRFIDRPEEEDATGASSGTQETEERLRGRIRQLERTIMQLNARIEQLTSG
jgi:hypothetical protein